MKQDGRLVRLAHRMVVVRDLDYLHSIDDANAKDERTRTWPAEIQSNLGPKWQIAKKSQSRCSQLNIYADHKLSSGSPVIHI